MFKNRFLYIFLHIIMWIGYTALPLLNAFQNDSTRSRVNPYTNTTYWLYVSITSIILFYTNSEVLFPKIYKKQPIRYFLSLIAVILVLLWGRFFVRITFVGNDINKSLFYVNAFIQYLYVFGISASYCFFSDYQKQQEIQRENENERLKSELSFLRSQISPHFMFNLMNSLVSLNRKKSNLVEPVLLKMADLLRYMLYEKDDKRISLENEVKYLSNYIDLQKVRFGDYVKIDFDVNSSDSSKSIEPMLLIPFVENAFKHGVGLIENPFIKIELETNTEELRFKVTNKFSSDSKEVKDGASGIGLNNVKRRLELLYPNKYILNVSESENLYTTNLKLNFK
ncbi:MULTISPECIES: sensor histidine kinase [Emticicia]|uniref:sensor histidine kinase n=1 Tax=Emticicia TaxID=312278 RepID=UPI0007D8B19E|nr:MULTISPECIES: histidine kinase [Emticicia]